MIGVNTPKVVCAVPTVLYLKGAKLKEITAKDSHFNLVEIVVVGVPTAVGVRPGHARKAGHHLPAKGQDT
jgi:hypothetical protein